MADYGMSDRPFYYMGDSEYHLLAALYVGDMNMYRQYYREKSVRREYSKTKTGTV